MAEQVHAAPLDETFDPYLQDKGKGRGSDGGNYRRNAARKLKRFTEWAAGERGGDSWHGIVPQNASRNPTLTNLNERVFREYVRDLAGNRGLKQNTVTTYYAYVSAWCGWCVNEGYLEATLSPDQFIVEFSGDDFDTVDVAAEAVKHALEQFCWVVFPYSPPIYGSEHGEHLQEGEVKMLEQRHRHRISVFE